ncbi:MULTISPECIES: helix-turn-helix domain-containing protein [unclassified Sedimentibacter]|uniref:helix-turn-helix domain-containing protein n=1 Tax=unclassified Sedimentibacter TaxID=2649220 RepID=UPI0027E18636|nr:helix-turn-helix transcriptional regulator [Sedimentibacter sp. MB35-C1]WMJ77621.1 helix-turn-helix transcriptional regulator [Sedimentibacter sp. MB35-C1]
MNNQFGNLLKKLITEKGTKEKIISQKLGYDPTYLSKWISGKNLPSQKSIDSICEKLSGILSEGTDTDEIKINLKNAYYSDLGFSKMESNMSKSISVITSDSDVTDLIVEVLQQLEYSGIRNITINTTLNLFQRFEYHIEDIITKLHKMNLESLKINMCASFDGYPYDPLIFCNNFISLISRNYFIDFNIYKQKEEIPQILVINDAIAMNVVSLENVVFLCYYSFNEKYIQSISSSYNLIVRHMEKILSYAMPISLRKTNVQMNQFMQDNQSILFSESPAVFIPKNVICGLIENNELNIKGEEWSEHVEYLEQVSNIFDKYTRHYNIKILVYESLLSHYINTGRIEIGGKKHVFTKDQVKEHILNICSCMRENENIEFYSISDTIDFNRLCCETPSVFLTPTSIAVGNTNIYTDETSYNFYYSTEKSIIKIFERYMDSIIEKSSCIKLSADRLSAYIE